MSSELRRRVRVVGLFGLFFLFVSLFLCFFISFFFPFFPAFALFFCRSPVDLARMITKERQLFAVVWNGAQDEKKEEENTRNAFLREQNPTKQGQYS